MRPRLAWLIVAVVIAPSPVIAEDDVEELKDSAYDAFAVSDYDTAIADYKKAYRLTHDSRLFYNLALSHRKRFQLTGVRADAVEARDYFTRFVELTDPEDAERSEDRIRLEKTLVLARGYIVELDKELASAAESAASEESDERVTDNNQRSPERPRVTPAKTPWARILLVSAGALVIGGSTTGVLALQHERASEEAIKDGDILGSRASGTAANQFAVATDVMLGAAIVTGGLGLYLVLSGRETSASDTDIALSISPSQVGAALTVRY